MTKIRIQRLLVPVINCVKMYPNLSTLETTKDFFCRWANPFHHTSPPRRLWRRGPS